MSTTPTLCMHVCCRPIERYGRRERRTIGAGADTNTHIHTLYLHADRAGPPYLLCSRPPNKTPIPYDMLTVCAVKRSVVIGDSFWKISHISQRKS